MISSLLMLSLTAFVGCACVVPLNQVDPKRLPTPETRVSNVDNNVYYYYGGAGDCDVYPSTTSVLGFEIYGSGDLNGVDYSVTLNDRNGLISNTFDYDAISYNNIYVLHTDFLVGNTKYTLLRFYVPLSLNFTSIEFDLEGTSFAVGYGDYNDGYILTNSTESVIIDNSSSITTSLNTYTSNIGFHFNDYYFILPTKSDDIYYCDWYFLTRISGDFNSVFDSGYQSGYHDGYHQGFVEGSSTASQSYSDGYAVGYSEGLSVGNNASFSHLFNAIADTPIVFIRSLFNFDLFGMNVFIIIMSLLTGIVVIYIIKKVWK